MLMMTRCAPLLLSALALLAPSAAAEAPDPDTLLDRMLAAAGGREAFAGLGVLQLTLQEEETTADGNTVVDSEVAYIDTAELGSLRLEIQNDVVLATHAGIGWASQAGVLDDRPQAPRMAAGAARQKLFPLLLPFSLEMPGVNLLRVSEGNFEGEPIWQVAVGFDQLFFTSAVMNTTWYLAVRRSDHALLAAQFSPSPEMYRVQIEGVLYRFVQHRTVDGVQLPTQVLLEGVSPGGQPTGHVRITTIGIERRGAFEPTLFMNPQDLEELEESIPGIDDAE
jgi:hypothetical protein